MGGAEAAMVHEREVEVVRGRGNCYRRVHAVAAAVVLGARRRRVVVGAAVEAARYPGRGSMASLLVLVLLLRRWRGVRSNAASA